MNNFAQFGFQNRHARGRILNVGSNCDSGGLLELGAVNVDLHRVSPATSVPNVVNVLADARSLPFCAVFDTVVLGDILEHLSDADIVRTLREAIGVLLPNGHIVITCPNDTRPLDEQRAYGDDCEYGSGIQALHHRPMPLSVLAGLVYVAGLNLRLAEPISYPHFRGWGLIVC